MTRFIEIGTYDAPAETIENRYEVACWWQKVEVPAAVLPVSLTLSPEGWPYWVVAPRREGMVVDEYFPALWGGVPQSSGRNRKLPFPGEAHGWQRYAYHVAEELATKPDTRFRIDPRVRVFRHSYEGKELKETAEGWKWLPCERWLYGLDVRALEPMAVGPQAKDEYVDRVDPAAVAAVA